MKIFQCPSCGAAAYFENLVCVCGEEIAYAPFQERMVTQFAPCRHRSLLGCNWAAQSEGEFCFACATTFTHPDISVEGNTSLWARGEAAKRWVFANLIVLAWLTPADPGPPPKFDLLSEVTSAGPTKPIMGHDNGLITINLAEADPVEVVARREQMHEPYRTMIGHYRHEIAHYLFLRLSEDAGFLQAFRDLFGDERADYGAALETHYKNGAPAGWQDRHISAYASSHPHEDWAETAAHALHLLDMIDSTAAVGLLLPDHAEAGKEAVDALLTRGLELGIALNHINRSMGLEDIYPFVVSPAVREKLAFACSAIVSGPPKRT